LKVGDWWQQVVNMKEKNIHHMTMADTKIIAMTENTTRMRNSYY